VATAVGSPVGTAAVGRSPVGTDTVS